MINNLIIKKRKFLPLFLLLIVLSSCNSGYKSELKERTNTLLNELKRGELKNIPGFNDKIDQLDSDTIAAMKDSFSTLEINNINVKDEVNSIVDVSVDITLNNTPQIFIFQYYKDNSNWVLSDKLVITQNITYVPGEIKKEAE